VAEDHESRAGSALDEEGPWASIRLGRLSSCGSLSVSDAVVGNASDAADEKSVGSSGSDDSALIDFWGYAASDNSGDDDDDDDDEKDGSDEGQPTVSKKKAVEQLTTEQVKSCFVDYDSEYEDRTVEEYKKWKAEREESCNRALAEDRHAEARMRIGDLEGKIRDPRTTMFERDDLERELNRQKMAVLGIEKPVCPTVYTYPVKHRDRMVKIVEGYLLSKCSDVYIGIPRCTDDIDAENSMIKDPTWLELYYQRGSYCDLTVWFYRENEKHCFKLLIANNGTFQNATNLRDMLMRGYATSVGGPSKSDTWKAKATWLAYDMYRTVNNPMHLAFAMGTNPKLLHADSPLHALTMDNFISILGLLDLEPHLHLPVPFVGGTKQVMPAFDKCALHKLRTVFSLRSSYMKGPCTGRGSVAHNISFWLDFGWKAGAYLSLLDVLCKWASCDGRKVFLTAISKPGEPDEVCTSIITSVKTPCGKGMAMGFKIMQMYTDPAEFGIIQVYRNFAVEDEDEHDGYDSADEDEDVSRRHDALGVGPEDSLPDTDEAKDKAVCEENEKGLRKHLAGPGTGFSYDYLALSCCVSGDGALSDYKRRLFIYDGHELMKHCHKCIGEGVELPSSLSLVMDRNLYRPMRVGKRYAKRWVKENSQVV
jgi:hypothetical protein